MQFVLACPVELRMIIVFVVASFAASLANGAIYHFRIRFRVRTPWQLFIDKAIGGAIVVFDKLHPKERQRRESIANAQKQVDVPEFLWRDFVPVCGWWFLRRESKTQGAGYWLRPLAIELIFPLFLTWLYWWETESAGLIASQLATGVSLANLSGALHWQFLAHALLAWFMLIATFIDIDDRIIPDIVTVPCALLGLAMATCVPLVMLPQVTVPAIRPVVGIPLVDHAGKPTPQYLEPVHLAASSDWPAMLNPSASSLAIALGCFWLWSFAYTRKRWNTRRGIAWATWFFLSRMANDWWTTVNREISVLGTLAIVCVWWWGGPAWIGLLSSLVGLVGSGGIVWLIRIVAGAAMNREAMGFGDVLLMMMIGTLVGWQAGVIIFFLAPFAALLFAITQYIARRDNEIPYGPYLCAATLYVLISWDSVWGRARIFFDRPWIIVIALVICILLCGGILAIWQAIKNQFLPEEPAE